MVTRGSIGMMSGKVLKIERWSPALSGALSYCAMPKSLSNIQFQMRQTTDTGRM